MNHNGLLHNYLLLSLDFQETSLHSNMMMLIGNVHNIAHFELYSYRVDSVDCVDSAVASVASVVTEGSVVSSVVSLIVKF